MTNNQKRQQVYKQMFTLSVMNAIYLLSIQEQNPTPSLQETIAYLDHQNSTLALKAKLTVDQQNEIIAVCHDRVATELNQIQTKFTQD